MKRFLQRHPAGPAHVLIADRIEDQTVGSVDIAVAVDQHERGRHRRPQRLAGVGVGPAGSSEQPRRAAQIPGHVGADIGGQGQAAAAVTTIGTQLSGTQQRADSTNGVPTPEDAMSSRFQQRGDVLAGFQGRCRQVPCAPVGLSGKQFGELLVGLAAFGLG